MNNKLSLADIAALLSERTGKDKKATEQFLREFIQVVSAGLFTDKIVKIKGLGTFKIVPVEERESVHVNTGERFIIPAHYKYSFLPDKELRDTVNAPFAFFETTEIGNDVDFSDLEEAEETETVTEDESIEEVLPEDASTEDDTDPVPADEAAGVAFQEETEPQPGNPVREAATTPCDTELQPEIVTPLPENAEEGQAVPQSETVLARENRLSQETTTEPIEKEALYEGEEEAVPENSPVTSLDENPQLPDVGKPEENESPAEFSVLPEYERIDPANSDQEQWSKKSATLVKIAIPLLLLVIALVYLGSLFYEWHTNSSGNAVTLAEIQSTQPVDPEGYPETDVTALGSENGNQSGQNAPTAAMPANSKSASIAGKKQPQDRKEPVAVPLPATRENTPQAQKPVVRTPVKIIDKVKIGAGDRLTLISLKYYGHKFFWVYLYEANKDIIKNPNNVQVGTTIKIPAPEVYGIDAHDKASVAKAAALQAKIIQGKD